MVNFVVSKISGYSLINFCEIIAMSRTENSFSAFSSVLGYISSPKYLAVNPLALYILASVIPKLLAVSLILSINLVCVPEIALPINIVAAFAEPTNIA